MKANRSTPPRSDSSCPRAGMGGTGGRLGRGRGAARTWEAAVQALNNSGVNSNRNYREGWGSKSQQSTGVRNTRMCTPNARDPAEPHEVVTTQICDPCGKRVLTVRGGCFFSRICHRVKTTS